MPLSSTAADYCRALFKTRETVLHEGRDADRQQVRVGFQGVTEPDVKYVREVGEAYAECMADAFEYDGQKLATEIIREILAATDAEMANPAAGSISRVEGEISLREMRTRQRDPAGTANVAELGRRMNRARADALYTAENTLTVRMHRANKEAQSAHEQKPPHVTNIYNLTGPHSRVNVQSHDQSVNVSNVTPEELFVRLRADIQQALGGSKHEILERLDELEQARGTNGFLERYQRFIASAAAHAQVMQLLIPYVPALTQMLK